VSWEIPWHINIKKLQELRMAAAKQFVIRLVKTTSKKNTVFWKSIGYDIVDISRQVGSIGLRFHIEGKLDGTEESIELKVLKNRGDKVPDLRIKDDKYKSVSSGLWFKEGVNDRTKEPYKFYSGSNFDSRALEDALGRNIEMRMFRNVSTNEKAPQYTIFIGAKSQKTTTSGGQKAAEVGQSPEYDDNLV
jgi:hypothetical protein